MRSRLRTLWRQSRHLPIVGAALRTGDRLWWAMLVSRSGLVDVQFYCAQRGWRTASNARISWDYVTRGYQRGMSPNPLFDELFAGRALPEVTRVPALYAYLVSDKPTVPVHPWWDAVAFGAGGSPDDAQAGPLERLWKTQADIELSVGSESRVVSFSDFRANAVAAARAWARKKRITRPEVGHQPAAIIRIVQEGDRRTDLKLTALADLCRLDGLSPAAVFVKPSASQWVSSSVFGWLFPAVRIEAEFASQGFAKVVGDAATRVSGDVLMVVDPRAELTVAEIRTLISHARQGAAVIPASRDADGTLAGLGAADVGAHRPWRILATHPAEDVEAFGGDALDVPLLTGRTFALPFAAYLRCGGLKTHGADAYALETLSQALTLISSPPARRVLTSVQPVLSEPDRVFGGRRPHGRGGRPRTMSSRLRASAEVELIVATAGFDILGWRLDRSRLPVPELRWLKPASDSLRWALKICAPAGEAGEVWGDTHFAHGLANALRRLGQTVVIDAFDARSRPTTYLDDVSLAIRGPYRIEPPATGIKMQWVISHPDEVSAGELSDFDRVFSVSPRWALEVSRRFGVRVDPLLEATDADLFYPRGLDRGGDIVFVGTARGIPRPSVVAPLRAGIPVRVYGPDWRPFISAAAIAAQSIPNSQLSERYETASIVLNDHWPAMRRAGFMAMRPFDVVAAGGRVVSERVDDIEELFGGAVVAYDSEEELVEILRSDPADLFPSDEELASISARIRIEHSFDARARTLRLAAQHLSRRISPRR